MATDEQPTLSPEPKFTCGDFGGVTSSGTPCKRSVIAGLCSHHKPEGNAGGRPKKEFEQAELVQIEKLSAVLTQEQLANFFEMSESTFAARLADDERVSTAYKKGRAAAVATVGVSLLRKATSGNVAAMCFYLKCQAQWRENDRLDIHHSGSVELDLAEVRKDLSNRLAGIRSRLGPLAVSNPGGNGSRGNGAKGNGGAG